MIRKGRRWFHTNTLPKVKPGQVIWLRSPKNAEGSRIELQVTVGVVVPDTKGYRVVFTPGDTRDEYRYLSAGWPDYTTDPFRAMPGEPEAVPDTLEERRERQLWRAMGRN